MIESQFLHFFFSNFWIESISTWNLYSVNGEILHFVPFSRMRKALFICFSLFFVLSKVLILFIDSQFTQISEQSATPIKMNSTMKIEENRSNSGEIGWRGNWDRTELQKQGGNKRYILKLKFFSLFSDTIFSPSAILLKRQNGKHFHLFLCELNDWACFVLSESLILSIGSLFLQIFSNFQYSSMSIELKFLLYY